MEILTVPPRVARHVAQAWPDDADTRLQAAAAAADTLAGRWNLARPRLRPDTSRLLVYDTYCDRRNRRCMLKIDVADPHGVAAKIDTLAAWAPHSPAVLEVAPDSGAYLTGYVAASGESQSATAELARAAVLASLVDAHPDARPAGQRLLEVASEHAHLLGTRVPFDRSLLGRDRAALRRHAGARGTLHGDLQPRNVLLSRPGEPVVIAPQPAAGPVEYDLAGWIAHGGARRGDLLRDVVRADVNVDVGLTRRLVAMHARAIVLDKLARSRTPHPELVTLAKQESWTGR
jgi:hypothetical protein